MRNDGQTTVLCAACWAGWGLGLQKRWATCLKFCKSSCESEGFADSFRGSGLGEQVSFILSEHRNTGKEKKVAIRAVGSKEKSWEKL